RSNRSPRRRSSCAGCSSWPTPTAAASTKNSIRNSPSVPCARRRSARSRAASRGDNAWHLKAWRLSAGGRFHCLVRMTRADPPSARIPGPSKRATCAASPPEQSGHELHQSRAVAGRNDHRCEPAALLLYLPGWLILALGIAGLILLPYRGAGGLYFYASLFVIAVAWRPALTYAHRPTSPPAPQP